MVLSIRGKGLCSVGNTTFVFVPSSALSEKANEITSKTRKRIEAEIAAGKYSLKTAEQLKTQLEYLEKNVPSCEIINSSQYLGGACESSLFFNAMRH